MEHINNELPHEFYQLYLELALANEEIAKLKERVDTLENMTSPREREYYL